MVNKNNCTGCQKPFVKKSKSGYCAECFHSNINNVKTEYGKSRWKSGVAKIQNWKHRGAEISQQDLEIHEKQTHCELCKKEFTNDKCMDHDHSTGKYRGTLCRQCNAALGNLGDDIDEIIKKLYWYKNTKEKQCHNQTREHTVSPTCPNQSWIRLVKEH